MTLASLLNRSATIMRATVTVGNHGEAECTWQTLSSDVPCMVEISGADAEREAGVATPYRATAFFSPDTGLRSALPGSPADHVLIDENRYVVSAVIPDIRGGRRYVSAELIFIEKTGE